LGLETVTQWTVVCVACCATFDICTVDSSLQDIRRALVIEVPRVMELSTASGLDRIQSQSNLGGQMTQL